MKVARVLALLLLAGCGGGSSHDHAPPPATAGGEGWITRSAPTSTGTYFASEWTVTLEGEAFFDAWSYSGEVAPPVRWSNRQAGVSGTAADTVTWEQFLWTIYPARRVWHAVVPLVGGENEITVEARSGSNWARTTLTVSHAPGSNPPSVGIDPVAPGSPFATNTMPLVLHGSAAGYLGIASVAWSNAAGSTAGLAEGTAQWTAAIPLLPGENAVTITAFDPAGTAATASAVITYDPGRTGPFPSGPVGVAAAAGDGVAVVQWDAAPGALGYNVYWAAAGGVRKATYASLPEGGTLRGVTAPCAIAGLRNETAYGFIVTAVDAVGEGVESAEVGATPTAGATCPATGEASLVTGTTARLNGSLIVPSSLATSAWFQHGSTPALGSTTSEEPVAAARRR